MTMNGVEVEKTCDGDPDHARDVAAGYLIKIGYALVERTEKRVHLKFNGRWFTTDPEEHTHHAYVSARPGVVHFEFTTGIVASYWTEKDRKMADDRAEAAVRSARQQGGSYRESEEAMRACAYCGKINLVDAARCSCCGATPRA